MLPHDFCDRVGQIQNKTRLLIFPQSRILEVGAKAQLRRLKTLSKCYFMQRAGSFSPDKTLKSQQQSPILSHMQGRRMRF